MLLITPFISCTHMKERMATHHQKCDVHAPASAPSKNRSLSSLLRHICSIFLPQRVSSQSTVSCLPTLHTAYRLYCRYIINLVAVA